VPACIRVNPIGLTRISRIFCESAVLATVRAAETPSGPPGWAWCPGHRLGDATRPSGVDLLQIIYMFFAIFSSFGLFGPPWDVLCRVWDVESAGNIVRKTRIS